MIIFHHFHDARTRLRSARVYVAMLTMPADMRPPDAALITDILIALLIQSPDFLFAPFPSASVVISSLAFRHFSVA